MNKNSFEEMSGDVLVHTSDILHLEVPDVKSCIPYPLLTTLVHLPPLLIGHSVLINLTSPNSTSPLSTPTTFIHLGTTRNLGTICILTTTR